MRRHLFLIVRVLIAVCGIGYIVWSLTWTDHVQVPSGVRLPDGQTLAAPTAFPIIEGDGSAFETGERVVIAIEGEAQAVLPMDVPVDPRGQDAADYQFKPGIVTTLGGANFGMLLLGLLLVAPTYPMQAYRWVLLLRARGLQVSYAKSFRLVMVGCFFNFCMPGSTGGDVIKAYYAAKGSGRRADAIMSVIFDRIAGLIGLIILGGVAGLFMVHHPAARRVTVSIFILTGVLTAAALVYFVPRFRRWFGVDWLVGKLPGQSVIGRVDEAAVAYRNHKTVVCVAILLSTLSHCCFVTATIFTGFALGIAHQPHTIGVMAAVLPVLFLSAAIPISYQGLGIMEGLGVPLMVSKAICTANQLIGMLMLYRLYMVTYSLLGSLYLLRGDIHLHPQASDEVTPSADSTDLTATTES